MKRINYGIPLLCILCALCFSISGVIKFHSLEALAESQEEAPIIVIDAGHGGEDSGALSLTGIKESDINLSIALKLEQVLALCGLKSKMIRSEDISVFTKGETIRERKRSDLNNRIEMINCTNGILVSIHQNHFPDRRYHGAQVFYADTLGSPELANRLQNLLCSALDPSNRRKIKQAESVFIMKKIQCTGVLVECGFLSNPNDEGALIDSAYQTKLSGVIGCALAQHLIKGEKDVEI